MSDKKRVTLSGREAELPNNAQAPALVDPRTGQHKDYWILSDEERAKGFVRPVRTSYVHKKCGMETTMGREIAETYARNPKFYGATFCCTCCDHYPVHEFTWSGTDKIVGSFNKNCVLYHSNCYDGFGSAYAAWKFWGNECIYVPCSYNRPVPKEVFEGGLRKMLYILDFSFNEETLIELHKVAEKIVILDHHKTAQEMLEPLIEKYDWLEINFDMERSGALMSWEHFHKNEEVPKLIQHISDRDLWNFDMEGTKELHKALVSYPMDFKLWDTFEGRIDELKAEGKTLNRMYDNLVANICKAAWKREIDGYEVPVVNTSIAWSEVGHRLLELYPDAPFAASFTVFNDQVMWSLRSRENFDVSQVAKKFGGGGHKQAAGFKTVRF